MLRYPGGRPPTACTEGALSAVIGVRQLPNLMLITSPPPFTVNYHSLTRTEDPGQTLD